VSRSGYYKGKAKKEYPEVQGPGGLELKGGNSHPEGLGRLYKHHLLEKAVPT